MGHGLSFGTGRPVKVAFAIPTISRPYQQTLDALAASVPLLDAAGLEHCMVSEVGSPYISCARATMLRKALDAACDAVVFIDHDVSWKPEDLVTLIQAEGEVVAGTYRFKQPGAEKYMGAPMLGESGKPICRKSDGAILAHSIPAGFLKVTRKAVGDFMRAYPQLVYGDPCAPSVDLFNHGAHDGLWWGEDYAFARRWRECGGEVWLLPNLDIAHHSTEEAFPGNYHRYLLARPGGKDHA